MNTFEITIQRKAGDGWPVVVEWHQSGVFLPVRSEDVLRLSEGQLTELTALAYDALAYGTLLGQALFSGQVLRAFDQARAAGGGRLRILLSVEAPDLETLYWERLCAPLEGQAWDHLALDQRAPFSLYLPSSTDRRFPAIGQRDLRALLLVASPENLADYQMDEFDAAGTVASVQRALGEIPCDVLATVEGAAGPPTVDALSERITAGQYTLLHIVAHGQVKGGEMVLYLADEGNQVAPVTGADLIRRLRRLEGARGLPHFVFLSTCESAKPEAAVGMGGLAQRLVEDLGVPAVLAMTEKVSVATAEALGERFYGQLREHGEPDRALVEACAGLAGRPDVTVPALFSRLGGRPLFSDAEDRDLTEQEIAYGLEELGRLLPERAPVRQESFAEQAERLRGMLGADRAAMSPAAGKEWDEALAEANALSEEVLDLNFRALALGKKPPAYDGRCPFPGLRAFGVDWREFFFGREPLVERLAGKLAAHNFLAVLGPSGSGKSSLVLAGLVPALQDAEPGKRMAYMTPGSDPVAQLEAALAGVDDGPTMLVVDQFEELLTLCTDEEKREVFLERLLTLTGEMRVVLTMRADFWGECAPYRELKEAMQAHQELIAPMDAAELRRAMERQAGAVGLRFEADLANTILDEIQGEPGAMPLLQHALRELWERRHGRWLRVSEYRAVGGVRKAIAETADKVYEESTPEEWERLRDIFLRLTRLDEEAVQGEEWRDTRRRAGLAELVPAGDDAAETKALVNRLADARLVVTGVNPVTGAEEVEVGHEALIRYWPRLRGWLEEDRAGLRLRAGIHEAAEEWRAHRRDQGYLVHRGARLEEAEALCHQGRLVLNQREQRYLNACVALRERERREAEEQRRRELEQAQKLAAEQQQRAEEQAAAAAGLRKRAIVIGMAAAVAVAAFVLAFMLFLQAEEQRGAAVAAGGTAVAERDARATEVLVREAAEGTAVAEADARATEVVMRQAAENTAVAEAKVRATREAEAIVAKGEAEREARIARSRQLAAQTISSIEGDAPVEQSLLLAVEAYRATEDGGLPHVLEADDALRRALAVAPMAIFRHEDDVRDVAYSPDGTQLATASDDGTARLLDTTNGQEIARLRHAGEVEVTHVAFSPDGARLVTQSNDGTDQTVRLWDTATAEQVAVLLRERLGGLGLQVVFAPYGARLAIQREGRARLFDSTTGELLSIVEHVSAIAFNQDGTRLATGSQDGTVHLVDTATGEELPIPQHDDWIYDLSFNQDGTRLTTRSADGMALLLDASTGDELVRLGPENHVSVVSFSPDGTRLATGGEGLTRLWDAATGEELATLRHEGWVDDIAFSLDGTRLATMATEDSFPTARLWDIAAEREPVVLHSVERVWDIAFDAEGTRLAIAKLDGTVRVVDTTGDERAVLPHRGEVFEVAFSPGGAQIVTHSRNPESNRIGFTSLWDVFNSKKLADWDGTGLERITFSPDGRWLVTGRSLVQTATGAETAVLRHEGSLWEVAFSPDSTQVATHSDDGTVRLWGVGTGPEPTILQHREDGVDYTYSARLWDVTDGEGFASLGIWPGTLSSFVLSPDGTRQVADCRLWDTASGEELARLDEYCRVESVDFDLDGTRLAVASFDVVRLWDAASGEEMAVLQHKGEAVGEVAFSSDGKRLATRSGGAAHLWDVGSGKELAVLRHEDSVVDFTFSLDGMRLATGSEDGTAHLVDAASGEELAVLRHEGGVLEVAFSRDGRRLATRSGNATHLWDPANGEEVAVLRHEGGVEDLAFSRDGTRLATRSGNAAHLWDAADGKEVATLRHRDSLWDIAFGPDGTKLASASADGTVRLWDASSGEELTVLRTAAASVGFSADGTQLVTYSSDGTVSVWQLNTEDLAMLACEILSRDLVHDEWQQYLGDPPYRKTCLDLP